MAKTKLTSGRIADFKCPTNKAQAFLWCAEVPGLAVRATPGSNRKRYVFESKVKGRTMRLTIGDVSVWSIANAQVEARRLQTQIDQGKDPRQIKADIEAAQVAAKLAKEKEASSLIAKEARESVTVAEAWQAYVAERSASMKDGKPEWGDRHRTCHEYLTQPGGVKQTSGLRKGQTAIDSWLDALRRDKRLIFVAASAAQKAVDFVLEQATRVNVAQTTI